MSFLVPIIKDKFWEVKAVVDEKLENPSVQRKAILVIVSIALLLDNMLYMVIVPIIPHYLRSIGSWETHREPPTDADGNPPPGPPLIQPPALPPGAYNESFYLNGSSYNFTGPTSIPTVIRLGRLIYEGEDSAIGLLFASKAIVQLMVNPFSGFFIDRIGYDIPMMVGLTIMFFSTAIFACGDTYGVLFFARSLQGVGSAFADTSGLAMIADRFTVEHERTKALGIANAFISFGCLVAPPFGGLLYEWAGKQVPFLILSLVCLMDALVVFYVMRPDKKSYKERQAAEQARPQGTPLWRLMMDPYIAVCAGALSMSNVALAFLEPTIATWMMDNMNVTESEIGLIWLPAFFPHVLGVYLTVKLANYYPQYQWLMAAGGLALEGLACFIVPFARAYAVLIIPICFICFGVACIDTALLPTLGYLVDIRYTSVYGSIYAIADISYSLAYAIGPIIAGGIVESIGFIALNLFICFSNLGYAPVMIMLRHVYDYKPFEENEANVLMGDPPAAQYQTYMMHDNADTKPKPISNEVGNHLEYGRQEYGGSQGPTGANTQPHYPQHHQQQQETAFNATTVPVSPFNPFMTSDTQPSLNPNGHTVQHRHISSKSRGYISSEDETE